MVTDKLTQFRPSANQNRVLTVFQKFDYDIDVIRACELGKISREAFYRWFHKPGFSEWWLQQVQEFFGRSLPKVYAALYKMSVGKHKGNHAAAKILLDRFDGEFVPRTAQDVSVDDKRPEEMTIDEILTRGMERSGVKVGQG